MLAFSRANLSRFLNGKASLSKQLAGRLETVFGISAQDLLTMQTAYDAHIHQTSEQSSEAAPYVVPFLGFKANDLEKWADRIPSRSRLAVLLRILVHSTGDVLSKVDFPGNDDAERPGWDGFIESQTVNTWIPAGTSGWEFGTNQAPKQKAEKDYAKSVKAVSADERRAITFVFVTPRRWSGKACWAAQKQAEGNWRDIRVYDASDLEQWLEQSLPGRAWFANETGQPTKGVRALDQCWTDWADVTNPPLPASLFDPAIEAGKEKLKQFLANEPQKPFLLTADSTDEAVAFISQALGARGGEELVSFQGRSLVFAQPGVFPQLANSTRRFVAITANREVEREFGPYTHKLHTLLIYPRNALNQEADITLEPLHYQPFDIALREIEPNQDRIQSLGHETGRSLTVLRRRLSTVPAIQSPDWSQNLDFKRSLIPFCFAGAWDTRSQADKDAIILLANAENADQIDQNCLKLTQLDDAPMWQIESHRGVISKIDSLFAVADAITQDDLECYFCIAECVLGEDDPSLDLPEQDQCFAVLYGKSRQFSATLRKGISETLVLLALHGDRIKGDVADRVDAFVRKLLTPLTPRRLEANAADLTTYAEAAPKTFLSIIEEDLRADAPVTLGLVRPANSGLFGTNSPRTDLLWALEGLAWNPAMFVRTVRILARLCDIDLHDNLYNKPINSLKAIFSSWMPQTEVLLDDRVAVLKKLYRDFPKVVWEICIGEITTRQRSGHYNHKPKWRTDGRGFGEPIKTLKQMHEFMHECLDILLSQNAYSVEMLSDLIKRIPDMPNTDQERVWRLVDSWLGDDPADADKAVLREEIQTSVLSHAGKRPHMEGKKRTLSAFAQRVHAALEPSDIVQKHLWMFRHHWIAETAEELEEDADFRQREERNAQKRAQALREIFDVKGATGVFEVAEQGNSEHAAGRILGHDVLDDEEIPGFLSQAVTRHLSDGTIKLRLFLKDFLCAIYAIHDPLRRNALLLQAKDQLTNEQFFELLLLAPFEPETWALVAEHSSAEDEYWNRVDPERLSKYIDAVPQAVQKLMEANRPIAAFNVVRLDPKLISPRQLFDVLLQMHDKLDSRPPNRSLDLDIQQAFEVLNTTADLSVDEMAELEFCYITVLKDDGDEKAGRVPNLEKHLARNPDTYVEVIRALYKPDNDTSEPDRSDEEQKKREVLAQNCLYLLKELSRIPGRKEDGTIDRGVLARWVSDVRAGALKADRLNSAERNIGELFTNAPAGNDGVWPCEAVRDTMEEIGSRDMSVGFFIGVLNSRGFVGRGKGGDQERELAGKYRKWMQILQYTHPFVSGEVLRSIVESYEGEAQWHDNQDKLDQRLLH